MRYLVDTDWVIHALHGSPALRHGLTLLSNNLQHFKQLQGLSIISI